MNIIDFTNCIQLPCNYGGSEKKKKILYDGEEYLLKFPDPSREKNKPISYKNNVFSEYVGYKIFELLEIPVQKVILGKWIESKDSNVILKEKVVVACRDFTKNADLLEVSEFSNSITDVDYHFTTDIKDVNYIISKLPENTNKQEFINRFWDVFIVDTLIGNVDRHLSK